MCLTFIPDIATLTSTPCVRNLIMMWFLGNAKMTRKPIRRLDRSTSPIIYYKVRIWVKFPFRYSSIYFLKCSHKIVHNLCNLLRHIQERTMRSRKSRGKRNSGRLSTELLSRQGNGLVVFAEDVRALIAVSRIRKRRVRSFLFERLHRMWSQRGNMFLCFFCRQVVVELRTWIVACESTLFFLRPEKVNNNHLEAETGDE